MTPSSFMSSWFGNPYSNSVANKSNAVVHWAFTTLIVASKPSRIIVKQKPLRGSTK
jgi:hypothetical protein